MKILHIIPSLGSGGAERMLSKIVNSQPNDEHVVITLTNSVIIYDFKNTKIIKLNRKSLSHIIEIIRIINDFKPTVINTWMNANLYALLLKIIKPQYKIIFNIRHDVFENKGVKGRIQWLIGKLTYIADLCIYVSETSYINHMKKGFNKNNAITIPNCFEVPNMNLYKTFKKDKIIIGYVGRLDPLKNQIKLLDILNNILSIDKNVEIWLAGSNLNNLPIREKVYDHQKVKCLGEVSNLDNFYKSINLLLLTSKKEGFPNVIGEAMSYGVPVAATNAGDSHTIIGGCGYKIDDNKSNEDISNDLYQMITNRKILKEKSKLSKARIEMNYASNKILNNIKLVYKKIGEKL